MAGGALAGPRSLRLRAPDGVVLVRVWPAQQAPSQQAPSQQAPSQQAPSQQAPSQQAPSQQASSQSQPQVLLALHGWSDSSEVFAPLASALSRTCTVVAPDAPAHGGTPLRPGRYVIAEHATSATAVLDALPRLAGRGHRSALVYGHSMGALTAARLAAARPGLVRGLILEEPSRTTAHRSVSSERMRNWLRGLRSGDHASRLAWARVNHPDWPDEELEPWARSKESVDEEHLHLPADWGEPLSALLSEVHQPVLIIRGDPARGGIVSRTAAHRCAAACPGGARVLALDAGHFPRRESPAEVHAALTQALTSW